MAAHRLRCPNLGRFRVAEEFIYRIREPGDGTNLFDRMVVLEANYSWEADSFMYTAIHPDFAALKQGQMIPEYRAVFEPGKVTPRWERIGRVG